jgi:CDP-diacylglycerol--glycerol-3-phosphate 3-phosphatidyltransferase
MHINLPNSLTIARFILAIIFLVLVSSTEKTVKDVALLTFVLAGITDPLDGYLARRYSSVTRFGRLADPFVDKFLICGAFILFVGDPKLHVPEWVAIVIVAREFVVIGLRGFIESRGTPFGATFLGKAKMVVQFSTVCLIILFSAHGVGTGWEPSLSWVVYSAVWLTVVVTVASGLVHIYSAITKGLLTAK